MCWQAAAGRDFFRDPSLYAKVRLRLLDAHRRRGRRLVDYTLTPTEIHVVSEIATGDSVGAIARAVGNVIARWVRGSQALRGHVFAGPYRSYPLGSAAELRAEIRMQAWRPVYLGLCKTPTHHAHGALRTALGLIPAHGFNAMPLLELFGYPVPPARAALRHFLRKPPTEREWRLWELTRGLVLANGSGGPPSTTARELRGAAAAALVAAAGSGGIDGALRLLATWVAAKLDATGALDLHTNTNTNAEGARGRALVACLAAANRLCSASAVARHFGRAKSTLSEQMTACKSRAADRQLLGTPVQRIIDEAIALETKRSSRRSR